MFAWRNVSSISLCYETRSELGYMGEIGHYLHVNARNVRLNDRSSWQSENFGKGQANNYSPGSYATLPVKKSQQKIVAEPDYDDAEFHSYSTLPNFKKNQGHRGYESEAEYGRKPDFRSIQDIHETLKHADINGDDKLDFDEWRQDLKT